MERLRLLWIRVAVGCEGAASRALAEEYFVVAVCPNIAATQAWVRRFAPHVVCWEFEEADAAALRAMRDFKIAHPSLPLLMLTTQHSEALAVWAFRTRVWNYLIKPVATSELRANFGILTELVRDAQGPSRSVRCVRDLLPGDLAADSSAARVPALQAAVKQVEQHYADKLRQAVVSANCGMSPSNFSRAFKAEYGLTFSEYLRRFRIDRACRLLRQGSHGATTAGLAVGFEDASHFARAFRKLLGTSPSSYKRQRSALTPLNERRWLAGGGAARTVRAAVPAERGATPFEPGQALSDDAGASLGAARPSEIASSS
jgi:AraC-like DNA-binding protein